MRKLTTILMIAIIMCPGVFHVASAAQDDLDWDITSVDGRITEKNDSWWRFAYIVEIENRGDYDMVFDMTVQFLDADGFIVDDDYSYSLRIDARTTDQFTGYDLVTASVAENVENINASVEISDYAYVDPPADAPAEPSAEPSSEATPRRVAIPFAFIRSAPDASSDLVGLAGFHQVVNTVGLSDDGNWYELDSGSWIHKTALD